MLNTHNNNFIENIILYLFVIITILQCNSIYLYSTNIHISKLIINILWQCLLLVILFKLVKDSPIIHVNNSRLILFILIFSFISLFFIFYEFISYPSFSKVYGFKLFIDTLLLVFTFYYFYYENNISLLLLKFENIVVLISIISLIFLVAFLLKLPTNTSANITWGATHTVPGYFGIDFFTQINTSFLGLLWQRNSGIFTEPSMFSYVVTISLLIDLFCRHHKKEFNFRMIILLITIISTASTTGILVSFIALIYYIFVVNKRLSISNVILFIMIPLLFIFLKSVFLDKSGSIQTNTLNSSSNIRYDDIKAGFKAWRYHLLLGNGLGENSVIKKYMSPWRFIYTLHPKSSAGFSTVLAQGGLLLGLFYVLPTIIVSKYSFKLFGLALFSFIPFIFVISQGYYIYIMILSYFWAIILVNGINRNKLL